MLRPGDANEVDEAWKVACRLKHGPVLLVLTRQADAHLDRTKYAPASGVAKGAYILADAPDGKPEVILIGTGSEVSLCVDAYEKLKAEGVNARVVSMPSWEFSKTKIRLTKKACFPPDVTARVAVEKAARSDGNATLGSRGRSSACTRSALRLP